METSFAWLEIFLNASFWVAAVRIATPLIFGTLGEVISERAGVLNLGIEGIMTIGAMVGWMAVYQGAGLWSGVLLAAVCGGTFGLPHAMLTVPPQTAASNTPDQSPAP
jgi:simple sugar transport system permease protein